MQGISQDDTRPVVVHLVTGLNYGGLESRMVNLGHAMHHSRFRHVFCAITSGGFAEMSLREQEIDVRLLGALGRAFSIRALWRFAQVVNELRPSVVHCHGAEANLCGILVSSVCQVRARFSEEIGIPSHSRLGRAVFGFVHSLSSRVIAVSNATKDALIDAREVKESQCQVIESPANMRPCRSLDWQPGSTVTLAFVGRLEPIKNPLALLEAIGILKAEGLHVRLKVVGDGSLRHQMDKRIRELGIGKHVVMKGYNQDPFELLDDATLFVQPSVSEGMSMALVEAMSAGIPPLVTPVGGGSEVVESDVTGWFLKSLEPLGIAEGVSNVLSKSVAELNRVGKAASDYVSHRFSASRYVQELDNLYLGVLNGKF